MTRACSSTVNSKEVSLVPQEVITSNAAIGIKMFLILIGFTTKK
jgi:hypothetical protein